MIHLNKDIPHFSTIYFNNYEEREEAFRKAVFSLIPRKYSGPRLFWKDFTGIALEDLLAFARHPLAYITSNPRDGLAFGTAWQVLSAAAMSAGKANPKFTPAVGDLAGEFGSVDFLHQPIRTLSGGETVKLALAKAAVAAQFAERLVIASPFSWLSRENAIFFEKLLGHYVSLKIPVELLALEGEDADEPVSASERSRIAAAGEIGFRMELEKLEIPLESSLNPLYSRQIHALVDHGSVQLRSPCLIVGENGQGKSIIAKVLAGAIPYRGIAAISCREKSGPARLLFQDVITQTLLRSFDVIAKSFHGGNGLKPIELCAQILSGCSSNQACMRQPIDGGSPGGHNGFRSLLEVKTILVAVRLSGRPSALILDEPDWGLTKASAIALVTAIIAVAHDLGTPVVLISHKPWWRPMARSIIRVEKSPKATDAGGTSSFEIRLSCE
jgi:energy-coupling factor transporter ATP-binding protein EcfA2